MRKACKLSLVARFSTRRAGDVRISGRGLGVLCFKSSSARITDDDRVEGMVECPGECEVMCVGVLKYSS